METHKESEESVPDVINNEMAHSQMDNIDEVLIDYALTPHRIFFFTDLELWTNFFNSNAENSKKYFNYSSEELRSRFLNDILPNLNKYKLTKQHMYALRLLTLHPSFQRTDLGYKLVNIRKELLRESEYLLPGTDLTTFDAVNEFTNKTTNDNLHVPHSVLIKRNENEHFQRHSEKISRLSRQNHTLISMLLNSDIEIAHRHQLSYQEIRNRLHVAKEAFERNGYQLENVEMTSDKFIDKIKLITDLWDTLLDLYVKSFTE